MNDALDRLIDNLEFKDELDSNQPIEISSYNIDICAYIKEIFEKVSMSVDIEATLNIVMDILNEYLSPEKSFVLPVGGDIILERNLSSFSNDYVKRLENEGVLDWVQVEGKQTFKLVGDRKVAVAPLNSESNFLGFLILVFNDLEITPKLTDFVYISSQIFSVFFSKKAIYRELIEKSDNLEVKVSEIKGLYQELLIVHEFVNQVGSIFDEHRLFVKLIDMCSRALDIDQGFVLHYDQKNFQMQVTVDTNTNLIGKDIDPTDYISFFNQDNQVVSSKQVDLSALKRSLQLQSIFAAPVFLDNSLYALVILSERKTNKPYSEQDERILLSLTRQAGNSLYNIRLHEHLIEKEKIDRDLELASNIQLSLLPKQPPQMEGLDIDTFFKPVKQVGGDYYDFYQTDNYTSWFFIGDVSGKGISAAILMATLRSMLKSEMRKSGDNPGYLLTGLNNLLCPDIYEGKFITFLAGELDIQRERIVFSNAGHLPMLIYRRQEDLVESFQAMEMPLGITDKLIYPSQIIYFKKGDILLLYTDGINEAKNVQKEEFGLDRLTQLLKEASRDHSQKIIQDILKAVRDFTGDIPQYDDLSLMVIKRDK
ncbi:MAG TPA: SpoIIE family protein phosphatase [Desulfohalobiaceae bacterium]|nr:SpoIIE family protein phosphatase [Desulfohalobiaceae bacterium]